MAERAPTRLILELRNDQDLREAYRTAARALSDQPSRSLIGLRSLMEKRLDLGGYDYDIVALPSFEIEFVDAESGCDDPEAAAVDAQLAWLVFGIAFADARQAAAFMAERNVSERARVGTDVAVAPLDSWCPPESAPALFHTRDLAHALIRAEALRISPPLEGRNVNVIVADDGLFFAQIKPLFPKARFVGGWRVKPPGLPSRQPGDAPPGGHGSMVARNVLSLAPRARIFDLPIVPPRMTDVTSFMLWIAAAYHRVRAKLAVSLREEFPGPWVFCNAWGIYDRRLESVLGNYTENPTHPFTLQTTELDDAGDDMVFGAGNCGQFCPDRRCGPSDRGPRTSIWGANSSPRVLTVGAVRADGIWLGYSSQGPGQNALLPLAPAGATRIEKPDLCLPSHFVDRADAHEVNGGTSAACGLAAGAIAALRSGGPLAGLTPAAFRQQLRLAARRPAGAPWNERVGYGILDLEALLP